MNIANFGLSGGEPSPRPGTGTVPASGGSMFGETLHFRLQLASSTAKLAALDGTTDGVAATGPMFPGLDGLELNALPERISFASAGGEFADLATEDTAETDELAPTLALLAPIVDSAPRTNVVEIAGGDFSARANALASIGANTQMSEDAGGDSLTTPVANAEATEEVLADPDGDVAALLRRVRASTTERTSAADHAPTRSIGDDADRTVSERKTEIASADITPRLDQVQGAAAQTRGTAPDLARFRAASTAVANAAAQAAAQSNGEKSAGPIDTGADQSLVAPTISDLRFGGAMRQAKDGATSGIRSSSAAEGRTSRIDTAEPEYEFDLSAMEPGTVEDTPLQRQVAASVADIRAGQITPFSAHHTSATNADPAGETGTRTETAQSLPLDQRFSDRLGAMVGAAMGNASLKDGMLRLQVTPDHLGPIEIEMDSSGASDRLQITVESEAVRQAVAQAHGRIEQELRHVGAKLAGIDVALRDSGADAQTNAHTNSQAGTDGRRPGPTITHDTASTAPDPTELRSAPRRGDAGNVLYA